MPKIKTIALCLLLSGCAGVTRSCTAFKAESFGSDWIIVQNDINMKPSMCWKLPNASVTTENSGAGAYWLDPHGGHLVHIAGWFNRVQVANGDWDGAAKSLGIDLSKCNDGIYGG